MSHARARHALAALQLNVERMLCSALLLPIRVASVLHAPSASPGTVAQMRTSGAPAALSLPPWRA
jgi:hypothetical protein